MNHAFVVQVKNINTVVVLYKKNIRQLNKVTVAREIPKFIFDLKKISISVLILSIFAILLGKTSPRGGKKLGVLAGVIVLIIYNNALLIAKSSLERGDTLPIIGLWWVHLLVLLIIFVFYAYRHEKLSQLIKKPFQHRYFNSLYRRVK